MRPLGPLGDDLIAPAGRDELSRPLHRRGVLLVAEAAAHPVSVFGGRRHVDVRDDQRIVEQGLVQGDGDAAVAVPARDDALVAA